jgi:anthranilate phosphoribosyltransferase
MAAGGKASDIGEGIALAERSIDSGAARERLDRLVAFSQQG